MIPVPERFVPRFIKQNRKIRSILFICLMLVFISSMIYTAKRIEESFRAGPRLVELREAITRHLFDSVATGLRIYLAEHGHYPEVDGKYFFDSIKQYINIDEVCIYADSVDKDGKMEPIKKHGRMKFDYRRTTNTYLGVGSPTLTIIYRRLSPNSYLLYSVGENCIDEGGQGDDVVYRGPD